MPSCDGNSTATAAGPLHRTGRRRRSMSLWITDQCGTGRSRVNADPPIYRPARKMIKREWIKAGLDKPGKVKALQMFLGMAVAEPRVYTKGIGFRITEAAQRKSHRVPCRVGAATAQGVHPNDVDSLRWYGGRVLPGAGIPEEWCQRGGTLAVGQPGPDPDKSQAQGGRRLLVFRLP